MGLLVDYVRDTSDHELPKMLDLSKKWLGVRHSGIDEQKKWSERRSKENIVNCYKEVSCDAGQKLERTTRMKGGPAPNTAAPTSLPCGRPALLPALATT